MRRFIPSLAVGAAATLVAAIVYILYEIALARSTDTAMQLFATGDRVPVPWNELMLLIVVILLGISAGHLYERFRSAGNNSTNIATELRQMTHSSRFWMSVVVSPIIYMSVYILIRDQPRTIVDYLLAFQNGFWWETVLRHHPGPSAVTPVPPDPVALLDSQPAGDQDPRVWSRP